jgi:hypothetical protein
MRPLICLLPLLLACPPSPVNPPPDADASGPGSDAGSPPPQPVDASPVSDAAPSPPAPKDASPPALDAAPPLPTDAPGLACAALVKLGCTEGCGGSLCYDGGGQSCHDVLAHALTAPNVSNVTSTNLACVAKATSGAGVRACGTAWKSACAGVK